MHCKFCKQTITIKLGNDGSTQGEYEYQVGHLENCILYKVDNIDFIIEKRIEIANKPFVMPKASKETEENNRKYHEEHDDRSMYWNNN